MVLCLQLKALADITINENAEIGPARSSKFPVLALLVPSHSMGTERRSTDKEPATGMAKG
jgi:hypothetical protein